MEDKTTASQKHAENHSCPEWDSNSRSRCISVQRPCAPINCAISTIRTSLYLPSSVSYILS